MGQEGARRAPAMELEALYQTHVRAIYGFVYSRVGNREAAEDLTSEVFLRAVAHVDTARDAQSVVAWLFRVARNAINDYWRDGHGAQVIPLESVRLARTVPAMADLHRQEQTTRRAESLLQRLPERYSAVLRLRLIDGLSVAETAQRMTTTEGNVKVLQHRALKRAAELQEVEDGDGR